MNNINELPYEWVPFSSALFALYTDLAKEGKFEEAILIRELVLKINLN